jgi:hypothetical protein
VAVEKCDTWFINKRLPVNCQVPPFFGFKVVFGLDPALVAVGAWTAS